MGNTTLSVSAETKARFDSYLHERGYKAYKDGKRRYTSSDAVEELMDAAGVPKLPQRKPKDAQESSTTKVIE